LSDIDFTKLRITRIDLETNLSNMQNQYNTDLEQLSALLGIDKPLKSVGLHVNESYTEYSEEDLVSKAYLNRYDLLSLQKQLESAKTSFSLARAMRIPNVTVGAEYDSFAPKYNPTMGVGFSVNIPIFDRNQGNIERKEVEYKQIEIQIVKTKRQIVSDVRQALYNYISSYEIFTSYNKKKPDMNYLMNNSEKAFAMGGITVLDLIDTEKTYFNYLKEYIKALTKLNLNNELINLYTGEMK
jgi:cobalt-zinc-cadmium efflux system outer membrane protein